MTLDPHILEATRRVQDPKALQAMLVPVMGKREGLGLCKSLSSIITIVEANNNNIDKLTTDIGHLVYDLMQIARKS